MSDVREWARRYRDRGFAVCLIRPGAKRPTDKGWNRYSLEPQDFGEGDSIGLQPGTLSGGLVCLDLDHPDVLQLADRYLPATGMVEGRPGKPRSHRWFAVKDVPPELTAPPNVAGGLGGPRTRRLKRPDGTTLVEFLGTGSQAVVPASVWVSKDGSRTEPRQWECFNDPAVVDCGELYEAACRLAAAAGHVVKERPRRVAGKVSREAPGLLPMPAGEAARQARAHLAKLAPAVEGQGGDRQTSFAACLLVLDYHLSPEEALPLLLEYNGRCQPPWTVGELQHKPAMADAQERPDRGWRVRTRSHRIAINLGPEGPGYVGVFPEAVLDDPPVQFLPHRAVGVGSVLPAFPLAGHPLDQRPANLLEGGRQGVPLEVIQLLGPGFDNAVRGDRAVVRPERSAQAPARHRMGLDFPQADLRQPPWCRPKTKTVASAPASAW